MSEEIRARGSPHEREVIVSLSCCRIRARELSDGTFIAQVPPRGARRSNTNDE
jgi:hypothetical protein